MPPITREQLVKYIKGLETKVKKFQSVLKERDAEIIRLKDELDAVIQGDPPTTDSVPESLDAQLGSDSAKEIKVDVNLKAKPLQDRPKTFIKKADLNADERVKQAFRTKTASMDTRKPADTIPASEENEISDQPVEPAEETKTEQEAVQEPPKPSIHFKPGAFLSAVIEGEEEADEITSLLERLDTCEPDQRRNILLSLTSVYWRMVTNMAKRMAQENLIWEKRLCMRFGMLDEKLMADRMDIWESLYMDKSKPKDTGIYFLDEWFDAIARGELKYSTIDEMSLEGQKPDPKATGAKALGYEVLNVPQMQRMCVGPRANLVAVLVQDYCAPSRDNPIVNRPWLRQTMTEILACDYKMFHRKYKGEDRIVSPLFIILPGYGQRSGCWEPYTPGKKGDTGPRICICAFPPRSSKKTLIMGISDYRWEYAKADAMHYWLSEGLTGKWIALFSRKEQRKDLKVVFQDSYMHWIVNESNRIPKLEKRFREFFWHNCPFSDTVKQRLKGGGTFGRLIELEEAKKKREEEEQKEIERIKAEREARRAKRKAQQ